MTKQNRVFLMLVFALLINACSNQAKQALGLNRKSPDEFTVISRAPLTVPPVFNMRPPHPGVARPQEETPRESARNTLLSSLKTTEPANVTSGEQTLLMKAGIEKAEPNIRQVIDQEATSLIKESQHFVDRLVFWKNPEDPTAVEVDPTLETKRIQENTALGKEITVGETPVIERRSKGIFEK